jgi:cobalt-zinc-cadmium efflux system protein
VVAGAITVSEVHRHVPARRVLAAFAITLLAATAEAIGSWTGRSLFLVADAAHLFAHLLIFGVLLVPRAAWHDRGEDVAATGVLLLVSGIAATVTVSSIRALAGGAGDPEPTVMLLSLVGLTANVTSAWLFLAPSRSWWSFRAALAHELSDGALTLAGLAGAALIAWRDWKWLDGALSLAIGLWLQVWAGRLLANRLRVGTEAWNREGLHG